MLLITEERLLVPVGLGRVPLAQIMLGIGRSSVTMRKHPKNSHLIGLNCCYLYQTGNSNLKELPRYVDVRILVRFPEPVCNTLGIQRAGYFNGAMNSPAASLNIRSWLNSVGLAITKQS